MVIQNGQNGLLVPVGDIEELSKAMNRVANDSSFANRIGLNAIEVREQYNIDTIIAEWIDVMRVTKKVGGLGVN